MRVSENLKQEPFFHKHVFGQDLQEALQVTRRRMELLETHGCGYMRCLQSVLWQAHHCPIDRLLKMLAWVNFIMAKYVFFQVPRVKNTVVHATGVGTFCPPPQGLAGRAPQNPQLFHQCLRW